LRVIGLPLADRQGQPVQPRGVLERQRVRGRIGRGLARRHRGGPVTGPRALDPVTGDLRQVRAQVTLVPGLDRVRRGGVQPALLRGAQPGGDRRADQRVREPVLAGTVAGDQEPGRHALVYRTDQAEHGRVQHLGHHPGREAVAGHRGGPQQSPGGLGQQREPVGRRLEHPSRHRPRRARVGAALLDQHRGQFPDQERVAPRLGVHPAHLLR
jgi:hypothetical protein